MSDLELRADEYAALIAVSSNLDVMSAMFRDGEHSPPGLRMVVASLRSAADILEQTAIRWEAA